MLEVSNVDVDPVNNVRLFCGNLALDQANEAEIRKNEALRALHLLLLDLLNPEGSSEEIGRELRTCASEILESGITDQEIGVMVKLVRQQYSLPQPDLDRYEIEEMFERISNIVDLTQAGNVADSQQEVAFTDEGDFVGQRLRVKSARHVLAGRIAASARQKEQDRLLGH